MGTLTSYVGAIFVGRPPGKGSTGFCWINIMPSTRLIAVFAVACINLNVAAAIAIPTAA